MVILRILLVILFVLTVSPLYKFLCAFFGRFDSLIRKKVNSIINKIMFNPSIPISLGNVNRITADVKERLRKIE